MRIVIDGRRLGARQTGVGRYLSVLLGGWAAGGGPPAEALVVLHDRSAIDTLPRAPGLSYEVLGEAWPGLIWERAALAGSYRPGDVLFAPTNLIPANWPGPSVLVLFDALLWSAPDGFTLRDRIWFGCRIRNSARRATRIVVPSRATAEALGLHLGLAPARLRVIAPAVSPEFRPRPADDPLVGAALRHLGLGPSPFLLFVGKASARRNLPALLDGFERHRRSSPGRLLVLVGPGTESFRGRPGVVAAGHVPDPILHGLIASAWMMAYPSSDEGFGLPVLEALASGCPVLTVARGALRESGGDAAYGIEEATPEAIGAALDRAAGDPGERSRRIALGLEHAAKFSVERFEAEIGEVLLGEGAGDPGRRGGP